MRSAPDPLPGDIMFTATPAGNWAVSRPLCFTFVTGQKTGDTRKESATNG